MSPDRFGPPGDPLVEFLKSMDDRIRRRERILGIATGLILIFVLALVGAALYIRGNDLEQQNHQLQEQNHSLQKQSIKIRNTSRENRTAIRLLCRVSHSFDDAIVSAADQIELNFNNGTYARLLKQGILTTQNVEAAKETLHNYRRTHTLLQNPKPCEEIGA